MWESFDVSKFPMLKSVEIFNKENPCIHSIPTSFDIYNPNSSLKAFKVVDGGATYDVHNILKVLGR